MPVSSFVQLAPSSIETNYLMFSPPQRIPSSRKENIPPQIKNSITFRQLLNENVPLSVNKASSREPKTTQVKKDSTHPKAPSLPKLILSVKKRTVEKTVTLMDIVNILAEHANPFINSAVFCDQRWCDEKEKEIVHWLNVLLTPPEQLNSSDELPRVDVADLLKSCNSELSLAPSRETVSSRYLVNHRLDAVRRKACAMFHSPCVAQVLSKVIEQIEKGKLSFRKDKKIVRDISFNTTAVELLLCYNPLWLRIGLETITGRTIPLESNSDRVGLIGFIASNILSDPDLVELYACPGRTGELKKGFVKAMKKHILEKCLFLVFFLDYAKENKLIYHNPGLFCKNAQYKGSHDLFLAFARELLSSISDTTKRQQNLVKLANLGYIVKHKQTYLDEFNYAVRHLGSDLQDGVRLTKVTEIILQQSLSKSLCTPAISKVQKMHNVKLALTALSKAGHVEGDITPENIVEGHREKTISLLWQIIYKFQLSRFVCAAIMIQKHWRGYIGRKQCKKLAEQTSRPRNLTVETQTEFVETLKPQYIPGPAMVSPGASMTTSMGGGGGAGGSVEERLTRLQMQQEMEGLRAEVRDLNEKLETLRAKRQQDEEKLKEHDKLRMQLEQMEEFKTRIMESQAALQRDLQRAKQEAREAIDARERHADEMADLAETVEMATLNKEMAEENAETLQLEQVRERLEVTLDLEILKAELSERAGGPPSADGSAPSLFELKQLQQQNAGLRETLVWMQDLSAHEKHEVGELQKELDQRKAEILELQRTKEKPSARVEEQEHQIADLQEQPQVHRKPGKIVGKPQGNENISSMDCLLKVKDTGHDLSELESIKQKLKETVDELNKSENLHKLLKADISMKMHQNKELQHKNETLAVENEALQNKVSQCQNSVTGMVEHNRQLTNSFTLIQEKLSEKEKLCEKYQIQIQTLNAAMANLQLQMQRTDNTPDAIEKLKKKIDALETQNSNYEREITKWKSKCNEMESIIVPIGEQMEEYRTECEALEAEKGEVQESMRDLSLQYAASFGHQNTKQKIQYMVQLKEQNMELTETVRNLKKTIEKLRKDGTNAGTNLV